MEEINVWQLITYGIISGAIGALALVKLYLQKSVENHVSKKLEEYKGSIQAKQRRLQFQLDALNHQRNLIQTNFLSKKIEAIEASHIKINKIIKHDFYKFGQLSKAVVNERAIKAYNKNGPTDIEFMSGFIKLGNEFRDMLDRNERCRYELDSSSIYVPENVQSMFMEVLIETKKIINEYIKELLEQRRIAENNPITDVDFSFREFVDRFLNDYHNETRKNFFNLEMEIRRELEPVSINIDDE